METSVVIRTAITLGNVVATAVSGCLVGRIIFYSQEEKRRKNIQMIVTPSGFGGFNNPLVLMRELGKMQVEVYNQQEKKYGCIGMITGLAIGCVISAYSS